MLYYVEKHHVYKGRNAEVMKKLFSLLTTLVMVAGLVGEKRSRILKVCR